MCGRSMLEEVRVTDSMNAPSMFPASYAHPAGSFGDDSILFSLARSNTNDA